MTEGAGTRKSAMRNGIALAGWGFMCVFGLTVLGAETPPADYSKAMKDIDAATQSLQKALAAEDFDTVTKGAVIIIAAFPVIEKYWTGKDASAVKWAQMGGRAAIDMRVTAGLKSVEGVAYSVKQLTDTCAQCHGAHREALPDGSFQIKF